MEEGEVPGGVGGDLSQGDWPGPQIVSASPKGVVCAGGGRARSLLKVSAAVSLLFVFRLLFFSCRLAPRGGGSSSSESDPSPSESTRSGIPDPPGIFLRSPGNIWVQFEQNQSVPSGKSDDLDFPQEACHQDPHCEHSSQSKNF